jgi:hypothetical protein
MDYTDEVAAFQQAKLDRRHHEQQAEICRRKEMSYLRRYWKEEAEQAHTMLGRRAREAAFALKQCALLLVALSLANYKRMEIWLST